MKLKLALAVLFAAGLGASFALAADSPSPSVVLCHRVAKPAHWVRVRVTVPVARLRMLKGDVWLKNPSWTCAIAAARHVRLKPVTTMGTTQGQPLPTKPTYSTQSP